jgi:hypothetical protein
MCDRDHQPEPYTMFGAKVIICDDIDVQTWFDESTFAEFAK